jgi:thiamine biosynthesis lipoprotein
MTRVIHAEAVMGTVVTVEVRATTDAVARPAIAAAAAWLHEVDDTFSTYRPQSEISRLNRGELEESDCSPSGKGYAPPRPATSTSEREAASIPPAS